MPPAEHTRWVVAIILGFVVVVAVAALLSLLICLIKRIDTPGGRGTGHAQGRGGQHR